MARRGELRPPWNLVLAALILLLADTVVFRSGCYQRVAASTSAAGVIHHFVHVERAHPHSSAVDEVLVIGDSGVGEAVSPAAVEAAMPGSNLRLVVAGFGNLFPRASYYLLRAIDPKRDRYRMVVVGLHSYVATPDPDMLPDDELDVRMLAPIVHGREWIDFAMSQSTPSATVAALARGLVAGSAWAADLRDLLASPRERLRELRRLESSSDPLDHDNPGNPLDMTGLSIDPATGAIHFPDRLTELQRLTYKHQLRQPRADRAEQMADAARASARYVDEWVGRIVDYYRGSGTVVVLIRMPQGPIPIPVLAPLPDAASVVEPFRNQPQVAIVDGDAFRFLERPENFHDLHHLNSRGRALFAPRLAAALVEIDRAHPRPR